MSFTVNKQKNVSKKTRTGLALGSICCTALAVMGSPVTLADSVSAASGARSQVLEEVVVTARRVSQSMQDVSVSVSAVSAEQLQTHNVSSVEDLNRLVPTLQFGPSATGAGLPSIQIRGQAQSRSVIGQDPSVAVYVSEFANTISIGMNQSLYDMQSVEVLRGPQGTLFGKNTTGGALLLTPARPNTDAVEGWVSAQMTNYSGQKIQGAVNIPINDNVAFRVAGAHETRDGYVTNIVDGRDYYDKDSWSVRASLLFEYDRFENLTIVDRYEGDSHNVVGVSQFGRPGSVADAVFPGADGFLAAVERQRERSPYRVETSPVSFLRSEATGIINTTTVDISDTLTLKNIIGYREVESSQVLDLVGLTVPLGLFAPTDDQAEWFSEELQLLGEHDTFNWIAGIYYYSEEGNNDAPFRLLVTSDTTPLQNLAGSSDNSSYSAFAQTTYNFPRFDRLALTAGARYTVDDRETTAYSQIVSPYQACLVQGRDGNVLPVDACERTEDETFKEWTYSLTLDYRVTDDVLTYLAHRRGYRSGGFNIRATSDAMFKPFEPEIVKDIEVGVKADWSLGNMPIRSNLAIYSQDYDDIQRNVNVILGTNPLSTGTTVINAASAKINGAELDVTLYPAEGLELAVSYAYTDAEYDTFVDELGNDLSDNYFYLVPKNVLAISGKYFFPLDASLGDLSMMISYFDKSKFAISDDNEGYLAPGYDLWSARLDWKNVAGSSFDLAIFGDNLSNEEYVTGGDSKATALGYRSVFIGTPRTYGIEARYSF